LKIVLKSPYNVLAQGCLMVGKVCQWSREHNKRKSIRRTHELTPVLLIPTAAIAQQRGQLVLIRGVWKHQDFLQVKESFALESLDFKLQ